MSPENKNYLRGLSILVIESGYPAFEISDQCLVLHNARSVDLQRVVPKDLLHYLEENSIDAAIIHPAGLGDKEEILQAHSGGRKLVVIKRDPPASPEERQMYKCFEEAGITTIAKRADYIEESTEALIAVLRKD